MRLNVRNISLDRIDIRTGWLQDSFRPHESEILQVELIKF
jgi:hypothetical protein